MYSNRSRKCEFHDSHTAGYNLNPESRAKILFIDGVESGGYGRVVVWLLRRRPLL